MWVKQSMPCLPPMTGNGENTTYKNGDDWGMVYYCFTHISNFAQIEHHETPRELQLHR